MGADTEHDGTGLGLVEFWHWAAQRGLMNKNTAGALRAVCVKVLEVEGDDLASVDLQTLDIEDLLKRFETLRKQKYKPQSLQVYKSRFRKAVEMYLGYLENPSGWRPDIQKRPVVRAGVRRRQAHVLPGSPPADAGSELVEYPFPIRPGVIATLVLPADLKNRDLTRLNAFLRTLTEDDESTPLSEGSEE